MLVAEGSIVHKRPVWMLELGLARTSYWTWTIRGRTLMLFDEHVNLFKLDWTPKGALL